ncbi:MAG: PAS domain S-box protein [Gemmatimonadaceae bacterium]|nr:PAS domain S-box protein [Gemmatimonadaceae bacterium]
MTKPPSAPGAPRDDARLLATLVDTAGSVMIGLRTDFTVFLWNRAAEQLYGVARTKALECNYLESFLPARHRAPVAKNLRAALDGVPMRNYVAPLTLPNGKRRILLWNVDRVPGEDGEGFGLVAVGQDITQRQEAEERFRLVFEHSHDGLLLSDETGVLDCNPAALQMLGREKHELIGRRPAEYSPPRQPDGLPSDEKSRALGRQTLSTGTQRFEWSHQRPDGSIVPVDVAVRHATLAGKRISVVSWHDLTHRKEMEREHEALERKLVQTQKLEAVGRLAGGVAHDFNNLLTAVRNGIELALESIGEGTQAHRDLCVSVDAVDRAAGLTRQLLAYSRHDSARVERLDLAGLACGTLRLMRTSIPAGIGVHSDCPHPAVVVADRSQLEQVVMNLLLNARDAIGGSGDLYLSVHADKDAGVARLRVRDTGVGMDDATRARIFEPFFTTKRLGGGTGLGLAVVYGVVAQAGGEIQVTSAPGEGSTFEVTLPLANWGEEHVSAAPGEHDGAERTILLVEDEDIVRQSTARLLSRLGWRVLVAEDGAAGWETFQRHADELAMVVTDVRMPRMDGLALARKIRTSAPDVPVLIVSGYDRVDGSSASAVEGTRFLAKPFKLSTLTEALEATLRRN